MEFLNIGEGQTNDDFHTQAAMQALASKSNLQRANTKGRRTGVMINNMELEAMKEKMINDNMDHLIGLSDK